MNDIRRFRKITKNCPSACLSVRMEKLEGFACKLEDFSKICREIPIVINIWGDRGSTVVKVLCYKSEVPWFDPSWCQWLFIDIQSFRSHCGPGVD